MSQQTKYGDNNEEQPSLWYIKAYKKHNAWAAMKGVDPKAARREFIEFAEAQLAVAFCKDDEIVKKAKDFIAKTASRF